MNAYIYCIAMHSQTKMSIKNNQRSLFYYFFFFAPQNTMNAQDRKSGTSTQAEWAWRHPERPARDGIPRPRTNTTSDAWWRTRTTAGTLGDGNSDRGASPPTTTHGGSTATYPSVVRMSWTSILYRRNYYECGVRKVGIIQMFGRKSLLIIINCIFSSFINTEDILLVMI